MHKPPDMTQKATLQCHTGGSLGALSYKMCWANLFEREDPSRTLESFMAASLLRKHPLKTFDLSLLVTPVHIAYFSIDAIRAHINSVSSMRVSVIQSINEWPPSDSEESADVSVTVCEAVVQKFIFCGKCVYGHI
eukprot:Protomagalhaensia_wolfi_Nauph_80__5254@NODE_566_length_2279_cov_719_388839_g422_i0_p4_GENE_NODE_566_length_2279_cov_719_388839_g422_i0NODE_566_length_2279_cov_719_388839_g422_i0_p4_ORF_typecomplete_len135_score20_87ARPC4/PF05856_12/0_019_NODE_566_length_2279_cov_719_388839_g422_i017652169